ncbi:MAG: hypothetical protein K9M82_06975, partial [Deltaproteobacteria bacterium]|nr:hypothetical protein [Deltaproteobacteria bacterium]
MKNRPLVPWTLAAMLVLFLALNAGCVRPRPTRNLAAAPPVTTEPESRPAPGGASEQAPTPRLEGT